MSTQGRTLATTRPAAQTRRSAARLQPGRLLLYVIAILASLLPTIDPVTLLLEMVPLILLYELSIQLARIFGQPAADAPEPVASEGS